MFNQYPKKQFCLIKAYVYESWNPIYNFNSESLMGWPYTHSVTRAHMLVFYIQLLIHPVMVSNNSFHWFIGFRCWCFKWGVLKQFRNAKRRPPERRGMWLRQVDITVCLPRALMAHRKSALPQVEKNGLAKRVFNDLLIYSHIFFSGLNAMWFMEEAKSLWRWHTHSVERKSSHPF